MNREPSRLCIDATPLRVPDVGIGVYTLRLLRALAKSRAASRVTVLVPESLPVALPGNLLVHRVRLPEIPIPLFSHFLWASRMASVAAKKDPGAVFHSPGPWVGVPRPRRFAVTMHDCIARRFPRYQGKWWVRKWFQRAGEKIASRADRVLTDSCCSRQDLVSLAGIPENKITVVYPWVDSHYRKGLDPAPLLSRMGLPSGYWLYVGGYDYRKNVEFLLDAYARARQETPCPPLVLAGRIPRDLRKPVCDVAGAMARNRLAPPDILLPGFVADEDLPLLYSGASLMIYPSLYEGFGLPPAEAIAVGTPVLASGTSSLPEVVRKAECRFDPANLSQLVEKLRAASRSPASFQCALPAEFTEDFAVQAYLSALGLAD